MTTYRMISLTFVLLFLTQGLMACSGTLAAQGQTGIESRTEPKETLVLGLSVFEPSVPVYVALDQHFFDQNGLNVTLQSYNTGLSAVEGLQKAEIDIAGTVAEYVLVGKAFENASIQTIGSYNRSEYMYLVGRKDHGIRTVSDLKGKRVGLILGTALHFYLGRFLQLHEINLDDIILVGSQSNQQVAEQLTAGQIDAAVTVDPFMTEALGSLGDEAAVWPVQNNQMAYHLFVCRQDWIPQHSKIVERFLRAIDQADEFILQHPDRAQEIAQSEMGFSKEIVAKMWQRNIYDLSLDDSLILAMEDEARWMIDNQLTPEKQVPRLLDYLYLEGLQAVDPEAVSVVR